MEPIWSTRQDCRVCGSSLIDILSLGNQYVVDFVKNPQADHLQVPLELAVCGDCKTVQLKHSVNPERLYKKFWYRSGINEQMKRALEEIVARAREVAYVDSGDIVLDIGANDGTLLGWYPGFVKTVGVDPCSELLNEGLKHHRMDVALSGFFSRELVEKLAPFKVITAIAMFYDIENPLQFLQECRSVLRNDGVMIIQMNYLAGMMENLAVDNICHEHVLYYSMHTLKRVCDQAGLEIVGAETNDVNGGSVRVYLTHKDSHLYGISTQRQADLFLKAMNLLHEEDKHNLDTMEPYFEFGNRIKHEVALLRKCLIRLATQGAKIYAYGASTRGTVLTQLLNLPEGILQGVAERDANKYDLHMAGSWLKIYPESYCRERATHFLVLPWHFLDSIREREAAWLKLGGKMIVPLPKARIITWSRTEEIHDESLTAGAKT